MRSRLMLVSALLLVAPGLVAQSSSTSSSNLWGQHQLQDFLVMSGATQDQFHPLTQHERFAVYSRSLLTPFVFVAAGGAAGISQWEDVPHAWGQGAEGFAHRVGDYLARGTIQRTLQFGAESVLHEDNRYFQSGKHGTWTRVKYAVAATVLARDDSGKLRFSFSGVGSQAGAAFLSRTWQPPSDSSPEHGAISFGLSMASNAGVNVFKEFMPALIRKVHHPK
jgi:hypothetical protein